MPTDLGRNTENAHALFDESRLVEPASSEGYGTSLVDTVVVWAVNTHVLFHSLATSSCCSSVRTGKTSQSSTTSPCSASLQLRIFEFVRFESYSHSRP